MYMDMIQGVVWAGCLHVSFWCPMMNENEKCRAIKTQWPANDENENWKKNWIKNEFRVCCEAFNNTFLIDTLCLRVTQPFFHYYLLMLGTDSVLIWELISFRILPNLLKCKFSLCHCRFWCYSGDGWLMWQWKDPCPLIFWFTSEFKCYEFNKLTNNFYEWQCECQKAAKSVVSASTWI